jgi:hypothetical protein
MGAAGDSAVADGPATADGPTSGMGERERESSNEGRGRAPIGAGFYRCSRGRGRVVESEGR